MRVQSSLRAVQSLVRAVERSGQSRIPPALAGLAGSIVWTLERRVCGTRTQYSTIRSRSLRVRDRGRAADRRGGLLLLANLRTESEAEEGIGSTQANARTNSRPTEIRSSSSKFPYRYHDLRRQLSHFQVLLLHERQLRGPGAGKVRAPERLNLRISWCTRTRGAVGCHWLVNKQSHGEDTFHM